MNILLGIYFVLIGAVALFTLSVDAKLLGLLEFIIGIGLLLTAAWPYVRR